MKRGRGGPGVYHNAFIRVSVLVNENPGKMVVVVVAVVVVVVVVVILDMLASACTQI
jgi:hypothetical protein